MKMGGDSHAPKVWFAGRAAGAPMKGAGVSPAMEATLKLGRTLPVLKVAWESPASLTAPQQPMPGALTEGPAEQARSISLASASSQQGLWQAAPIPAAADAARLSATARVRII